MYKSWMMGRESKAAAVMTQKLNIVKGYDILISSTQKHLKSNVLSQFQRNLPNAVFRETLEKSN